MSYNFQVFKDGIKKIEEWLGKEFSQLHTGQATPALLDGILVESYGSKMALTHVASVSIEDARTLRISPWDKSQLKEIERAVVAANLGLGTSVDDAGMRVTFPPLTTERRVDLSKVVRAKLEEARIHVRTAREAIWDDIQAKEKEGALTEDEKFRYKDELQKLVDEANGKLEELTEKKEKELMG
jgi:ribosome recycling factor